MTVQRFTRKKAERKTGALQKSERSAAAIVEDAEPPPSTRRFDFRQVSPFLWFFVLVLLFIGASLVATLFGVTPPSPAKADAPQATWTQSPVPTIQPSHTMTALPEPYIWPCIKDCSGEPVVGIEQNWRTLQVVNDAARAATPTPDRDVVDFGPIWAGWFDAAKDVIEVHYPESAMTHGTQVWICPTGKFTQNTRGPLRNYEVGTLLPHWEVWCQWGIITEHRPDPPITGEVRASVSQAFREYACKVTNADRICPLNVLTEIIIRLPKEQ